MLIVIIQSVIMLNVTHKPFVLSVVRLSVVRLNVIMLRVVAPTDALPETNQVCKLTQVSLCHLFFICSVFLPVICHLPM